MNLKLVMTAVLPFTASLDEAIRIDPNRASSWALRGVLDPDDEARKGCALALKTKGKVIG
jgi:hypothetical protein